MDNLGILINCLPCTHARDSIVLLPSSSDYEDSDWQIGLVGTGIWPRSEINDCGTLPTIIIILGSARYTLYTFHMILNLPWFSHYDHVRHCRMIISHVMFLLLSMFHQQSWFVLIDVHRVKSCITELWLPFTSLLLIMHPFTLWLHGSISSHLYLPTAYFR